MNIVNTNIGEVSNSDYSNKSNSYKNYDISISKFSSSMSNRDCDSDNTRKTNSSASNDSSDILMMY